MMSEGYDFVPFADRVNREDRPAWNQRRKNAFFGSLRLVFSAEQSVHVGSGRKRLDAGKVVRTGVRIQGLPGIPGSSMKGVLRSRYEAVTRSCVQQRPKREDKVRSQSHPLIERAVLLDQALDEAVLQGACRQGALCPACGLFGRMSLRSRITIRDLSCSGDVGFATAPIPPSFSPNLHHVGEARPAPGSRSGQEQFEVRCLHGRKFAGRMEPTGKQRSSAPASRAPQPQRGHDEPPLQYIEVIPAGSHLAGDLVLFNVLPEELGGLLVALGRRPTSTLKIGGGKGSGFGRIRLIDIRYELRDHAGRPFPVDPLVEENWQADFTKSHDRWPTGEAKLVQFHQENC
jgi:CRISPR/Cas system CSM-associated protein Csm3 (group 7 of RAMP superfamily)